MPTLIRYWGSFFKTPREAHRIAGYFAGARAAGWKCHLVCCRPPDDERWTAPVRDAAIEITYLPRAHGNFDIACVRRTRALCRTVRADVFHCDNTHTSPLLGAALAGVPVRLWSKHAMEPAFEAGRRPTLRDRYAPSLHLSVALATRVLPISVAMHDELIDRGLPRRKLQVLPLAAADEGSAPADRDAARRALAFGPDAVIVSTIGRAVPVKGWDVLLDAFAAVHARTRQARLLLVGSTTASDERPCFAALRDRVRAYGLDDLVRFAGHLTDITPVLAASDVFVLPSRSEGYSLALVEALRAGLPVVSTRVGIAPDVVIEGANGYVVDRSDAAALAARLGALVSSAELRARMSRPWGSAVAGVPDAREHADALIALYAELLSAARASAAAAARR